MTPPAPPAPPSAAGRGRRASWWALQARAAPYLFLSPFLALFAAFMLWPLGRTLALSAYRTAGPRHRRFVGLGNYAAVLSDKPFWLALLNTLGFTAAFVALWIPLSLGLAVLLNGSRVRFRNAFRLAFFSTHLVGSVFVAVLFAMVLSPRQGLAARMLAAVGLPMEIGWLTEPNLVMPSILLAALWISVGFGMVYFLAALQAVDPQLYDAARVDGAGRWRTFWHVTLPSIRPVLAFLTAVGAVGGLQLFELPWVLFQSGPGPGARGITVVMVLYQQGFEYGDLGYAAAMGWAFVAIVALTAGAGWLVGRQKSEGRRQRSEVRSQKSEESG